MDPLCASQREMLHLLYFLQLSFQLRCPSSQGDNAAYFSLSLQESCPDTSSIKADYAVDLCVPKQAAVPILTHGSFLLDNAEDQGCSSSISICVSLWIMGKSRGTLEQLSGCHCHLLVLG